MQSALPPWGPFWDHTSCAMLHDLPVCERPARPIPGQTTLLPAKTCHRYLLGVKWSQVQILSARQKKGPLACVYGFGGVCTNVRYRTKMSQIVPTPRKVSPNVRANASVASA